MDDETRFWIAQQVADTKYTANINPLFGNAKDIASKRPNTLISTEANDKWLTLIQNALRKDKNI